MLRIRVSWFGLHVARFLVLSSIAPCRSFSTCCCCRFWDQFGPAMSYPWRRGRPLRRMATHGPWERARPRQDNGGAHPNGADGGPSPAGPAIASPRRRGSFSPRRQNGPGSPERRRRPCDCCDRVRVVARARWTENAGCCFLAGGSVVCGRKKVKKNISIFAGGVECDGDSCWRGGGESLEK